jgi:hypothetical protein
MSTIKIDLDALPDRAGGTKRYSLWLHVSKCLVRAEIQTPRDASSEDSLWLGSVADSVVSDAVRDKLRELDGHLQAIVVGHGGEGAERQRARTSETKVRGALASHAWPTWSPAKYRLVPQRQVVDEILASDSLEAFADVVLEAARNDNWWMHHDDVVQTATMILERERNELASMLGRHPVTPERDLGGPNPSSYDLQRRLHRVQLLLEETSAQQDPEWPVFSDAESSAFAGSIREQLRSLPHEDVVRARMLLRDMTPDRGMDKHTLLAALMAACSDPDIWDAIIQVRTVERGREYQRRGGKLTG